MREAANRCFVFSAGRSFINVIAFFLIIVLVVLWRLPPVSRARVQERISWLAQDTAICSSFPIMVIPHGQDGGGCEASP